MANFLMLLNIMICLPSLVVCSVGMQYVKSLPITKYNIHKTQRNMYRALLDDFKDDILVCSCFKQVL